MRSMIANGFVALGFVAGAVAAAYYGYVMWGLDWGPQGTRGHNLMFVLMMFGAIAVFVLVLILFGLVAAMIDPQFGRDK